MYGKYISQADRNERKNNPIHGEYEGRRRKSKKYIRTQAEIDLCYALFGYDPVEEEAKMDDAREDAALYSELRNGG